MGKLLRKDREIYFLVLIVLSIALGVFATSKHPDIDLSAILPSANYICLVLNNIYIYYMFSRCKKIRSVYDKIITRIGQKKFFNSYILWFIFDIIIFFFIVIIPIYIKHGLNDKYMVVFILYLVLNFLNFFLQECVSMLIFLIPKGNVFISIPVFMNFVFHYIFIPWIMRFLFHF